MNAPAGPAPGHAREAWLVHLTEVRVSIDADIAEMRARHRAELADRLRLRAGVDRQIVDERRNLTRIRFLTRGARMSLGELLEHATTPDPPTTQEGHD